MSNDLRTGLLTAFRKLMRPLVRILMRHGITYEDFAALLKGIFVESAQEDFAEGLVRATTARISVLTGLTQEEVQEQQNILASGNLLQSRNYNQVTRLLVGWHSDPRFTGPYGLPIELEESSASNSGFNSLVKDFCPGIDPESMLEELIQAGVIERTTENRVKVLTRSYIPDALQPHGLEHMGIAISNFIGTVEKNMEKSQGGESRFERVVFADDGLPPNLMPVFDKLLREKCQQLLIELDNWISAQGIEPGSGHRSDSPNIQTGVGIYHYIERD